VYLLLPIRWLVYAEPFFQGVPRVLEVGGFPNPAAWGVEQPYVGSVHPLKIVRLAPPPDTMMMMMMMIMMVMKCCILSWLVVVEINKLF